MKIINHGAKKEEKKNSLRFLCENCGCVFDADEDEYHIDYRQDVLSSVFHAYSSCPECHKICKNASEMFGDTIIGSISGESLTEQTMTTKEYPSTPITIGKTESSRC